MVAARSRLIAALFDLAKEMDDTTLLLLIDTGIRILARKKLRVAA